MAADNAEKELMIHTYCRQGDRERERERCGCEREVRKAKGEEKGEIK